MIVPVLFFCTRPGERTEIMKGYFSRDGPSPLSQIGNRFLDFRRKIYYGGGEKWAMDQLKRPVSVTNQPRAQPEQAALL